MQSPSSSRRQSRRGGDWTFATDNNTGEVLWYCPPGGDDKFGNRVQLQAYFSKRGKPYPSELFPFRGGDVPPSSEAQANGDGEENGVALVLVPLMLLLVGARGRASHQPRKGR